jgi:hypothetical protein
MTLVFSSITPQTTLLTGTTFSGVTRESWQMRQKITRQTIMPSGVIIDMAVSLFKYYPHHPEYQ